MFNSILLELERCGHEVKRQVPNRLTELENAE